MVYKLSVTAVHHIALTVLVIAIYNLHSQLITNFDQTSVAEMEVGLYANQFIHEYIQ